jgi:RNA polymerase-binding protein DksA
MTALTKKKIAVLRAELATSRAVLLGQGDRLANAERELVVAQVSGEDRPRSEGDGDGLSVERDLVARLGDKSRQGLTEVDAALARIDAGTYGKCTLCGGAIPVERLEARPQAATCVPCASARR